MFSITKELERYGEKFTVTDKNNKVIGKFVAIIEPLRYKNKMYLQGTATEIGYNREDYYLIMASPDIDPKSIDHSCTVSNSSKSFVIDKAELVKVRGVPVYIWLIAKAHSPAMYPVYRHFNDY